MKRFCLLASLFVFPATGIMAGPTSLHFFGNYNLLNTDADGFHEEISFSNPIGTNSAMITLATPLADPLFSDAGFETIALPTLMFDETSYVFGDYFDFDPMVYVQGFKVFDDDGTLLLSADMSVDRLEVDGVTGLINSALKMNLTNTTAGASYTPGDSDIIDTFLKYTSAGVTITLQNSGNLSNAILGEGGLPVGTFSGAALSLPEPGSLALLGLGGAGLGLLRRRRKAKGSQPASAE